MHHVVDLPPSRGAGVVAAASLLRRGAGTRRHPACCFWRVQTVCRASRVQGGECSTGNCKAGSNGLPDRHRQVVTQFPAARPVLVSLKTPRSAHEQEASIIGIPIFWPRDPDGSLCTQGIERLGSSLECATGCWCTRFSLLPLVSAALDRNRLSSALARSTPSRAACPFAG